MYRSSQWLPLSLMSTFSWERAKYNVKLNPLLLFKSNSMHWLNAVEKHRKDMFGSGRNITLHSNGVLVLWTHFIDIEQFVVASFNRTITYDSENAIFILKVFVSFKLCRNKTRWPCRHESMGLKIRRSFYNKRNERASLKSVTHVELLHVGGRFASHATYC